MSRRLSTLSSFSEYLRSSPYKFCTVVSSPGPTARRGTSDFEYAKYHGDCLSHHQVLRRPGRHAGHHVRGCCRQRVKPAVWCPLSKSDVVAGTYTFASSLPLMPRGTHAALKRFLSKLHRTQNSSVNTGDKVRLIIESVSSTSPYSLFPGWSPYRSS